MWRHGHGAGRGGDGKLKRRGDSADAIGTGPGGLESKFIRLAGEWKKSPRPVPDAGLQGPRHTGAWRGKGRTAS